MYVERITDGEATAYAAAVLVLDPSEHPELETVGFQSETVMYAVFTSGQMWADYDRHRLARNLPGNARWVTDELRRVAENADVTE